MNIDLSNYYGPLVQIKSNQPRQHYFLISNETPALGHHAFPKRSNLIPDQLFRELKNSDERVKNEREAISQAIQRRAICTYQQLILAYGTGLKFAKGTTVDQALNDQAKIYLFNNQTLEEMVLRTHAVHTCALPCILATGMHQTFVFLQGSDCYNFWNATTNMLQEINEEDLKLDCKGSDPLRDKVVALLNAASKGALSPEEGLIAFLEHYGKVIDKAGNTLISEVF